MAEYRLYRFNERNEIFDRRDFDAADDATAVRIASVHSDSGWELWELGRRVASAGLQARAA